jgi:hypothetical protein
MAEIGFAIKAFIVSLILIAGMQLKVGNDSIEETAQAWMQNSEIAASLQTVASGAVLMIQNTAKMGKDFVAKTVGQDSSARAGRLNLDIKRSTRYEEEQQSKTDRNN